MADLVLRGTITEESLSSEKTPKEHLAIVITYEPLDLNANCDGSMGPNCVFHEDAVEKLPTSKP